MPYVAFEFDDSWTEYLTVEDLGDLVRVSWAEMGLVVLYKPRSSSNFRQYVDVEGLSGTAAGFVPHADFGFTLGQFSEFFVVAEGKVTQAAIQLGGVEVTLGQVTPLTRYLYDGRHDRDLYGEWESMHSIRVWGADAAEVERYVLAAFRYLQEDLDANLRFFQFTGVWSDEADEEEEGDKLREEIRRPPPIADIEPLRLYHQGLRASDVSTAILQFYRVLEYYSMLRERGVVEQLRYDAKVGPKEFLARMAAIFGDERAQICRLVAAVADASVIQEARKEALIGANESESHLGAALYELRNRLVHAKYDHRQALIVPGIFTSLPELPRWRAMVATLAAQAMSQFGTRG